MSEFLSLVLSGMVSGAVYAVMASGLVLTYTTSGVFNLAHGSVAFTTAYLFYQLNTGQHWPIVPSAIVSIVVFAPLLGVILDKGIFRGLARASVTAQIVGTVGLLIAIPALALWLVERLNSLFGFNLPPGTQVQFPPGLGPVPSLNWEITNGADINSNELVILGAAIVSGFALWLVVRHSSLGLRMRATVDRRDLAALRGTDPDRTSTASWILGMLLAGLAGVVAAPILHLDSSSFTLLLFVSATAAVLGRLTSIPLAFLGGLTLGVVQNLVAGYATFASSIPGADTAVPFILMIAGLFFLTRSSSRKGGVVADEKPPPDYLSDLSGWRRRAPWLMATAGLIVYVLWVATTFWQGVVVQGLALGLIFLSVVVVTGLGGMVSLAPATFVTSGALTAGLLLSHHVPFVPAALGGMVVAMLVGVLVASPALRLGGLALALATLALGFLGDDVVFPLNAVNNDQNGWTISPPSLGPLHLSDDHEFALVMLVIVGIVALFIRNLQNSPTGRAIAAMRSSELGAVTAGVSSVRSKLGVFAVGAAIAGLGGVMLATFNGSVNFSDTPVTIGLTWVAVTVLFGVRRPGGAVVAGLVYSIFPHILTYVTTSTLLPQILFGMGAVGLAKNPDGMLSDIAKLGYHRRQRSLAPAISEPLGTAPSSQPGVEVGRDPEVRPDEAASPQFGPAHPAPALVTPSPQPSGRRPDTNEPDSSAPEVALRLNAVRAGYEKVEVLHGVSLSVAAGTVVALLGANGAGKSTLCSVVAGLLRPSSGSVEFNGADVTAQSAVKRARKGLILAPETRGIFASLTVEENLLMWLHKAECAAVYDAFPVLGERRAVLAGSVSGGEQQMLTMAPLVLRPPLVLVADEPSLGLAPLIVEQLFSLFETLRSKGVSMLLVEEKPREALAIADQVILMSRGRVRWQGPPGDLDVAELDASYLAT
jgi:ABC-type branched-subunit amino acid transport system ATPase component/branched-subunit amino acid ABC-type transport system permease component